jgi:hypothetical protein
MLPFRRNLHEKKKEGRWMLLCQSHFSITETTVSPRIAENIAGRFLQYDSTKRRHGKDDFVSVRKSSQLVHTVQHVSE